MMDFFFAESRQGVHIVLATYPRAFMRKWRLATPLDGMEVATRFGEGRVYKVTVYVTGLSMLCDETMCMNEAMWIHDCTVCIWWLTAGRNEHSSLLQVMQGTPGRSRWAGPALGHHTDEILTELGLSDIEIQDLRDSKVIWLGAQWHMTYRSKSDRWPKT